MIQPKIQEVWFPPIDDNLDLKYLMYNIYDPRILHLERRVTFTPEEFEQFKREFAKELLEKAADNAKLESREYKPYKGEILKTEDMGQEINLEERTYLGINKESILNTLDDYLLNNKV